MAAVEKFHLLMNYSGSIFEICLKVGIFNQFQFLQRSLIFHTLLELLMSNNNKARNKISMRTSDPTWIYEELINVSASELY